MIPSRQQALDILNDFVQNENLKKHMYCLEACMRAYAKKFNENEEKWSIAGLLHDADWEKFPNEHPARIIKKLKESKVDEDIIQAIASHGNNSPLYGLDRFTQRKSLMDKTLFACDELAGFVIACALIRPDHFESLGLESVKKKLKDKAFARQVNREEIKQGIEELNVSLDEHIQFVIQTLKEIKSTLGL